ATMRAVGKRWGMYARARGLFLIVHCRYARAGTAAAAHTHELCILTRAVVACTHAAHGAHAIMRRCPRNHNWIRQHARTGALRTYKQLYSAAASPGGSGLAALYLYARTLPRVNIWPQRRQQLQRARTCGCGGALFLFTHI